MWLYVSFLVLLVGIHQCWFLYSFLLIIKIIVIILSASSILHICLICYTDVCGAPAGGDMLCSRDRRAGDQCGRSHRMQGAML